MRKMLIILALAALTATTGCSRCRNLFRRGSPCGGTRIMGPAMLGGAIPMGSPATFQQVPQSIIGQPMCVPCECCPSDCPPCEGGYFGGANGYSGEVADDCGCQAAPGEYFGGYQEGSATPEIYEGTETPQGSTALPGPTN